MLFIFKVRRLRANVENLHLDAVRFHQGEAFVHFRLAHARAFVALRAGVHVSVALAQVEIIVGPKMRVDVDAHALLGLSAEPRAGEQPGRRERTCAQHFAPRETASTSHDGIASSRLSVDLTDIVRRNVLVAQASACGVCVYCNPTNLHMAEADRKPTGKVLCYFSAATLCLRQLWR